MTRNVPSLLRRECSATAAKLKRGAVLYCPPLVPRGQVVSQNNLKTTALGNTYQFNFVSPSLAGFDPTQPKRERHHLGHWRFAAGSPTEFKFTLIAPGGRRLRAVETTEVEGISIRVYQRRATAYDIDEGHVFSLWDFDGRTFEMSVHGFENRALLVEMSTALIREIKECAAGDSSAQCALAFG